MVKLYAATDTGPSGFGEAARGVIGGLLDHPDIELTVRTHQWGLNRSGHHFQNRAYPDTRQAERLLREGHANEAYLIDRPADMANRADDLLQNLSTNTRVTDDRCLIRQFDGREDVWLAIGAMSFARQAPEAPYTIVSTDYNLDTVPETWPGHIDRVDEVWVPSEWTKQAIANRDAKAAAKVRVMPYGIDMKYRPTEYDCTVCPHNQGGQVGPGMKCLRDGTFHFLVVSRYYHIKGIYRTVRAYLEEFSRLDDDVRLLVKTTANRQFQINPGAAFQAMGQQFAPWEPPLVHPLIQPLETQQLYDLMGHVDAFCQLSRAECFGIAQLQAMWCETPVIHTDWSAQRELLGDADAGTFPVSDYTVERPRQEWPQGPPSPRQQQIALPFHMPVWPGGPPDDEAYPSDSKWASPDIDAIRARMREVYELWQRDELAPHGEAAREYVQENFRWRDRVQPRLERLREATA